MTDSSDRTASAYDEWGDWYSYIHGPIDNTVRTFQLAIENSLRRRLPSGLVVDAGCGTGLSTKSLLEEGYDVLGLDISARSLEKAADWLAVEYGERVHFEEFDLFCDEPPLVQDADGVFAWTSVLAHAISDDDFHAAIRAMERMLRPGGVIAFCGYDYAAMMAQEPDIATSPPVLCADDEGEFIFLQRRFWNGAPRSRLYKTQYNRMGLDGSIRRVEVDFKARTLEETSSALADAGFEAIAWHGPTETQYYKPICVATKKPAPDVHFFSSGLELSGSLLDPPERTDPTAESPRFQFYPEDLDRNPFQEDANHRETALVLNQRPDGTRVLERRRQSTLVMLSGGIDSVYVLARLLHDSDDEIIAHHIHFINPEGRDRAEKMACERIVAHLRETVRPFVYTESAIDRRRFQAFGMDDMAVAFEVGVVSNSFLIDRGHGIDRWTSGTCLEEELEYYGSTEVERFEHVLNTAAASCYPNPAPRFFQLEIIAKRDQIAYMGEVLTDLCWTCRAPVWESKATPKECGACKTCKTMGRIRAGEETLPRRPDSRPSAKLS